MVLVEDRARLVDVEAVLGLDPPRELEDGVEPGADPAVLGALLARALELVDLAARPPCGRPRAGRGRRAWRGSRRGRRRPRPAELAELLADGVELAAQQELALRLLHALFDVGLDLLAQRQVGEGLARPAEDEAQPRARRRGSRAPRPSGPGTGPASSPARSASRPGSVTLAELLRDAGRRPSCAGCSRARPGTRAASSWRPRRRLGLLGDRLDLDPQRVPGPGHAGADAGAVEHRGRPRPACRRAARRAPSPRRSRRPTRSGRRCGARARSRPPAEPAASAAARASSVSSAIVNTIPGSTTPEVRGSNGSVRVSLVIGSSFWSIRAPT